MAFNVPQWTKLSSSVKNTYEPPAVHIYILSWRAQSETKNKCTMGVISSQRKLHVSTTHSHISKAAPCYIWWWHPTQGWPAWLGKWTSACHKSKGAVWQSHGVAKSKSLWTLAHLQRLALNSWMKAAWGILLSANQDALFVKAYDRWGTARRSDWFTLYFCPWHTESP